VSITHEFLQLFVRTADEELLNFNADNVPKCIGLQTFSRLLNALRNAGRDVAALQKFYQLDTNNCLQRGGAMVAEQVQLKVHDDDDVTTKAEVIPLLREGVNILCCNGMHHNCEHQCLNQRSKLFVM
jgi:hypothetical protein